VSGLAQNIREIAVGVRPLLSPVTGIRPNFRGADLTTTAAAIRVLIEKGVDTPEAVYNYLHSRDCPHDLATVRFLLDVYAGFDRRQCLWFRTEAGRYKPLD